MRTAGTEKEYLVFADLKAWLSLKVRAKSPKEAKMLAAYQMTDLSLKELRLSDNKLKLELMNGEIIESNMEDFCMEVWTSVNRLDSQNRENYAALPYICSY